MAVLRWWRRQSLRFRLTATAAAVLALALAAGASVLLGVLGRELIATTDEAAHQQARQVVSLVDTGRLTDPVDAPGGTIVQVLDPTGRITYATAGADRLVPLLTAEARAAELRRADGEALFLDGRPYGVPDPLRVVVLSADHGRTVIVARPFGEIVTSVATTRRLLVVGTPLLMVLLAAASWVIIGRTLRPIEALRRGAADISGRVRSRRLPVPEANDEVHGLATTLNDMLARLEAADARQRALVSDAAHELRSPLASMRLQLEVALGHPDRQDWPETAEGVLEDTLRLSRLAEDLLALARLDESGGLPARRDPVDLDDLARQTADRYAEARVAVTVESPGPIIMYGDAIDLGRVLTNLIDNAVRHAGSKVEVGLRAIAGPVPEAVLTVADDGPGIPEADRERVFDRFTRLDTARSRDEGGAGLGLAIVRETVQAHGGRVFLENASPGLRAVVHLPLPRGPRNP